MADTYVTAAHSGGFSEAIDVSGSQCNLQARVFSFMTPKIHTFDPQGSIGNVLRGSL